MDVFQKNILEFNRQLGASGLTCLRLKLLSSARPDGIIVSGMGGSGLAGEIAKTVSQEIGLRIPVVSLKDYWRGDIAAAYHLKRPLYAFVSFSGNTEETLSGFRALLRRRPRPAMAALATGGELKRLAERHHTPLVTFAAAGLTPRQATGRMFYGLAQILRAADVIPRSIPEFTSLKPRAFQTAGKHVATKIRRPLVLVYTDETNKQLGYLWKIALNETAKALAFTNALPEMTHNEIVSLKRAGVKSAAIFLTDHRTSPRLQKRSRITEQLLKKWGAQVISLPLQGRTRLEKTWRTILLADWATYFLAKLNHRDPGETAVVDELKRLMKHA